MELTQMTRDFMKYCEVDPEKLTDLEKWGMANVLYSRFRECIDRTTPELPMQNLCFGEAWAESLECKLWWRLCENDDRDVLTLMCEVLGEKFPDKRLGDSNLLSLATYGFLAYGVDPKSTTILDKTKATSRYEYYQNQVKSAENDVVEELFAQAKGILPSLSFCNVITVLNRHPDITKADDIRRRMPELIDELSQET